MSISQITDNLFVGGRLRPGDEEQLKALGITSVLNVGWPDEPDSALIQIAFRYRDLTIMDDGKPKPAEWFAGGIELFEETIRTEGKLLVHCGHGINRSPAMAYAMLRSRGMQATHAIALLQKQRPQTATGATGDWFYVYTNSYEDSRRAK